MANINFTGRDEKSKNFEIIDSYWTFNEGYKDSVTYTELTYVRGGCVFVGILVELPGTHRVHLNEGDAPTAPLLLRLVDREEGLEEQIDNAVGDGLGVNSEASEQVVHVAHVPKLQRRHKVER